MDIPRSGWLDKVTPTCLSDSVFERNVEIPVSQIVEESVEAVQTISRDVAKVRPNVFWDDVLEQNVETLVPRTGEEIAEVVQIIPLVVFKVMPEGRITHL